MSDDEYEPSTPIDEDVQPSTPRRDEIERQLQICKSQLSEKDVEIKNLNAKNEAIIKDLGTKEGIIIAKDIELKQKENTINKKNETIRLLNIDVELYKEEAEKQTDEITAKFVNCTSELQNCNMKNQDCSKQLIENARNLSVCTENLEKNLSEIALLTNKLRDKKICEVENNTITNIKEELEQIKQSLGESEQKLKESEKKNEIIINNQRFLNSVLTSKNKNKTKQIVVLSFRREKLLGEVEQLKSEKEVLVTQLEECNNKQIEAAPKRQSLLDDMNSEEESVEEQLIKAKHQINVLEESREKRHYNDIYKKQLEKEKNELSEKVKKLEEQLTATNEIEKQIKAEIEEKDKQIAEKEAEIESAQSKIAELQACCDEKSDVEMKLKECQSKQCPVVDCPKCEEAIKQEAEIIDEIGQIVMLNLTKQLSPELLQLLNPKPNAKTFEFVAKQITDSDNSAIAQRLKDFKLELSVLKLNKF